MSEKSNDPDDAGSWTIESGEEGVGGIRAPIRGSKYLSSQQTDWRPTDAEGFWLKPLYQDLERGERTMLMKVDPGAFAAMHTHKGEFEQIYVVDGSFYDQDRTMGVGDYCCRAPPTLLTRPARKTAPSSFWYTLDDKTRVTGLR